MKTLPSYTPKLPLGIGVGYKAQHFQDILDTPGDLAWLEIHAEITWVLAAVFGTNGQFIRTVCHILPWGWIVHWR